jgi:isopenicillin N synthase-like dioxygenase
MSDFTTIPTLDLSLLSDPGSREALRLQMLHIVRNVGMCYVTNLPFGPEILDKAKIECEGFFNLPEEEKKKLDIANVPGFLGYTAVRIPAVSIRKYLVVDNTDGHGAHRHQHRYSGASHRSTSHSR